MRSLLIALSITVGVLATASVAMAPSTANTVPSAFQNLAFGNPLPICPPVCGCPPVCNRSQVPKHQPKHTVKRNKGQAS